MSRRLPADPEAASWCGAIDLDKPPGITSHDAVQRIRKIYGIRRVGHTGTLDPAATGVLPILVGEATRFSEFLLHLGKTYQVTARLGLTTDTQDLTGATLSTSDFRPEPEPLEAALLDFLGEGSQVPPMFSAVRVAGRRLHELAREGQSVERQPRRIVVDSISGILYNYPLLSYRIAVSSGTYVRTICHDLGIRVGCGAVMAELRRVKAGPFELEAAVGLDELSRRDAEGRRQAVRPLEEVFAFMPAVRVLPASEKKVGQGRALGPADCEAPGAIAKGEKVCILSLGGRMLAMGECRRQDGQWSVAPVRVLGTRPQVAPETERPVASGHGSSHR